MGVDSAQADFGVVVIAEDKKESEFRFLSGSEPCMPKKREQKKAAAGRRFDRITYITTFLLEYKARCCSCFRHPSLQSGAANRPVYLPREVTVKDV